MTRKQRSAFRNRVRAKAKGNIRWDMWSWAGEWSRHKRRATKTVSEVQK